jgi:hypothetical protein
MPAVGYAEIEELSRCAQCPLLFEDSVRTSFVVFDQVPIDVGSLEKKFLCHIKNPLYFFVKSRKD